MNEHLVSELVERAKRDQAMRLKALDNPFRWDDSVDRSNTKYLKQLLEIDGWPTISIVGEEASQSAWLIAQHADHDIEFQERCLTLMQNLPEGEIKPANIAYLEDRIRVNKGLPQLYGSQFDGEGKSFGPRPIEDEAHVDERRASIGLEPFAAYKAEMIERYTKKK